jgi:hypothetical protein
VEQSHHDVGAMIALTPEQCRRAALAVCSKARDADDALRLLEALGLRAALGQVPRLPRAAAAAPVAVLA